MEFASNASKLHRKVGELLSVTSPFKAGLLQQEVAVSELFPSYPNNKDKYDWVLPDLFTIVECHGAQHYKAVTFGGEVENAVMNFQAQQFRDAQKEEIALLHGWTYIIIPYTDEKKLTSEYLIDAYQDALNTEIKLKKKIVPAKPDWMVQRKLEMQRRSRQYRKEQYIRMKELKNGHQRSSTSASDPSEEEA